MSAKDSKATHTHAVHGPVKWIKNTSDEHAIVELSSGVRACVSRAMLEANASEPKPTPAEPAGE